MTHKISLPIAIAITFAFIFISISIGLYTFFITHHDQDTEPSLFGIPLIPPIFAQSGGPGLPDPQAGISSYVQRNPSLIDLAVITPIFDETIQSGDNYIIGAFNVSRIQTDHNINLSPSALFEIHVRVYVDTNGFIVAYLTKDKLAADIFRWHLADPPNSPLDTVLSDALLQVTNAIGSADPDDALWYHWNYPFATHFSAAAKAGTGNMYMQIPSQAIFSENPSYLWYSERLLGSGRTSGRLLLETIDGTQTLLHDKGNTQFSIQTFDSLVTPGPRNKFELIAGSGPQGDSLLGIAVIYKIP